LEHDANPQTDYGKCLSIKVTKRITFWLSIPYSKSNGPYPTDSTFLASIRLSCVDIGGIVDHFCLNCLRILF